MRIFLFYVNAMVGLDEWTDRKLLFEISNLSETSTKLYLNVTIDTPKDFRKLIPTKSYALQFEHSDGTKELKYYSLNAFEIIPPPTGEETYEVILHTKRIEVEA